MTKYLKYFQKWKSTLQVEFIEVDRMGCLKIQWKKCSVVKVCLENIFKLCFECKVCHKDPCSKHPKDLPCLALKGENRVYQARSR